MIWVIAEVAKKVLSSIKLPPLSRKWLQRQVNFLSILKGIFLNQLFIILEFLREAIDRSSCEYQQESTIKQELNLTLTAADQLKRTTIEDDIRLLRAQLPPIDYSVIDEEEDEIQIYNDEGQSVICSCTFKEVSASDNKLDEVESFLKEHTEKQNEPDEFMDQGKAY